MEETSKTEELLSRLRGFFRLRQPDSDGLRNWFRSFVHDLESRRGNIINTIEKFIEEVTGEASQTKAEVHKIMEEGKEQAKLEMDSTILELNEKLKNRSSDLEKQFVTMAEANRKNACTTLEADMKQESLKILSDFESLGKQKTAEVKRRLDSALDEFESNLAKEAETIEQNFRIRAATTFDRMEGQLKEKIEGLTSQVNTRLGEALETIRKTALEAKSAKMEAVKETVEVESKKVVEQLRMEFKSKREVWEKELDGKAKILESLAEEAVNEARNRSGAYVDAAVSRVEEEVGECEESLRNDIHAKMEGRREDLDRRIDEVFNELSSEISATREQLARRLLDQKIILDELESTALSKVEDFERQLEEALNEVRSKATKTIAICGTITKEEEERTKKLLDKIEELGSKRSKIKHRLDEIEQKLKDSEGSIEAQIIEEGLQEKIDTLTSKLRGNLDAVDERIRLTESYAADLDSRIGDLRARANTTLSEYESKISAIREKLNTTLEEKERAVLMEAEEKIMADSREVLESYQEELKKIASDAKRKIGSSKESVAEHSRKIVDSSQKMSKYGYTPKSEPPCPDCGWRLKWIPMYGRFYCYRCRKYAPRYYGIESTDVARVTTEAETELEKWYESFRKKSSGYSSQSTE